MKHLIKSLTCLLIIAVLLPTAASADTATSTQAATSPLVSDWAQEDVQKAKELGLVPTLYNYTQYKAVPLADYSVPITREQYVKVAMAFVALQQHCDISGLESLVEFYLAEKTEDGYFMKDAFTDGADRESSLAFYLGMINGRGDNTFDPNGQITRQEAAVVLTRAYKVCGGALPQESEKASSFTDEEKIADWAKESASALASWNVMDGMEDGSFLPDGNFTVEQCIVTFLRLYENAPVSRKNNNVTPLFTYEQALACESKESRSSFRHTVLRIEGTDATFLRDDYSGVMQGASGLYFVYRDGGVRGVDSVVWDSTWGFTPDQKLGNPRFSEDGKTFYFTITLGEDTVSYYPDPNGKLLYAKGIYHITVEARIV
jgi:hypothetical protein